MRILIASPIAPAALDALRADHDVCLAIGASEDDLAIAAADREAIVFRSGVTIGPGVLAAPDLRLLVRAGSGLDNLDVGAVRERGIELVRIPGPGAQAVAELTFGLMIALARSIVLADGYLRDAHWKKSELVGYGLRGKRLGIVGCGIDRIARGGPRIRVGDAADRRRRASVGRTGPPVRRRFDRPRPARPGPRGG